VNRKKNKMKKYLFLLIFTLTLCSLFGQQNTVSAGDEAASSIGSLSFSIGQVDYEVATGAAGAMVQGVQHPFAPCIVSINSSVTQPANGILNICSGDSVTLTSSSSTGNTWSTGETTPSIVVSASGNYAVSVDSIGCTSSSSAIDVIVHANPATPTIAANGPLTFCSGDSVVLTSGSLTGNAWSTGETSQSIVVSTSGAYTLTVGENVTPNLVCESSSTISLLVNPLPLITIASNSPACEGDSVVVSATANNGITFSWSGPNGFSSTNQNLLLYNSSPNISGNYSLTVTDANGCVNAATSNVSFNAKPNAFAGADIEICPGEQITLNASGGITYSWSPPQFINNAAISNPIVNPGQTQNYMVLVTDANGCSGRDTIQVIVKRKDKCLVHVYTNFTPNGDNVNDTWQIDGLDENSTIEVHIYNRWGDEVWKAKRYDNGNNAWRGDNQNGKPLPDGTYFYTITIDDTKINGYVEINR